MGAAVDIKYYIVKTFAYIRIGLAKMNLRISQQTSNRRRSTPDSSASSSLGPVGYRSSTSPKHTTSIDSPLPERQLLDDSIDDGDCFEDEEAQERARKNLSPIAPRFCKQTGRGAKRHIHVEDFKCRVTKQKKVIIMIILYSRKKHMLSLYTMPTDLPARPPSGTDYKAGPVYSCIDQVRAKFQVSSSGQG